MNKSMTQRKRYVPNLITDMAECDANYMRLYQLFPHMKEQDCLQFGIDASQQAFSYYMQTDEPVTAKVEIKIYQRCPYTTMLKVTVVNSEDAPWVRWPTMEVRVYDDAKSAEVISFEEHRNFKFRYALPNSKMYQPDEKSQINRYLGELLTHCIKYGYSLETVNF